MRQEEDQKYIQEALILADAAARNDEVPVGAIIVKDSVIIARGANSPIACHDPSAHAEIVALRQACRQIANYRLTGATLYVTLEPCIMCMGAIIHARIDRLVFGAYDPKTGAAGSCYNIGGDNILNHRLKITGGICETECGDMLRSFFRNKRKMKE